MENKKLSWRDFDYSADELLNGSETGGRLNGEV